ncbi:MAG: hypothetical protein U5O39_13695 [Gammaproteobacteria bacterium]|nr:hypothetical protein [Gammaproteobacteria bacterium]
MARVINPTDVFLPFDVRTFNTEYRIGVDAIRFQRPFRQLGEIDFGMISGSGAHRRTQPPSFSWRANVGGRDLQFSAIRFAEQNLIGGGLQTSLGESGFWFGGAWVSGAEDYRSGVDGSRLCVQRRRLWSRQYHFNGAGSSSAFNYPELLQSSAYRTGGVFLLGRHYLIGSVSIQASPLWSLGTRAIRNLSDDSTFASATATWNAMQNLYIDLGVYAFTGDAQSEFGSNPETLYASVRFYFSRRTFRVLPQYSGSASILACTDSGIRSSMTRLVATISLVTVSLTISFLDVVHHLLAGESQ